MTEKSVKTVCIVSLSSGIIGESYVSHEVEIGIRRLLDYGIDVRFSEHARMGIDYIKNNPESRASDLLSALYDPEIDMILCAIGGDDTYRLLPYLFDECKLEKAVKDMNKNGRKKIFLGFSDTTINHLMFYKTGLNTFYGQAFLPDLCEIGPQMPAYSRRYFEELIKTGTISNIIPSDKWYEERSSFAADHIGTSLKAHKNNGFELLQGSPVFSGKILGGCIDSIGELFETDRYEDMPLLAKQYELFPSAEEWEGKILLLESSEEKMPPDKYRRVLTLLKEHGLFERISGVLVGKPICEIYYDEYKKALTEIIEDRNLPIVFNVNIGHAQPRCIIPFGIEATVDILNQNIVFTK